MAKTSANCKLFVFYPCIYFEAEFQPLPFCGDLAIVYTFLTINYTTTTHQDGRNIVDTQKGIGEDCDGLRRKITTRDRSLVVKRHLLKTWKKLRTKRKLKPNADEANKLTTYMLLIFWSKPPNHKWINVAFNSCYIHEIDVVIRPKDCRGESLC